MNTLYDWLIISPGRGKWLAISQGLGACVDKRPAWAVQGSLLNSAVQPGASCRTGFPPRLVNGFQTVPHAWGCWQRKMSCYPEAPKTTWVGQLRECRCCHLGWVPWGPRSSLSSATDSSPPLTSRSLLIGSARAERWPKAEILHVDRTVKPPGQFLNGADPQAPSCRSWRRWSGGSLELPAFQKFP